VADLRGHDPHERALIMIERCAAPEYRDALREYLSVVKKGHEPLSLRHAFAMHDRFVREGDMRGVRFAELAEA
jgi:acyl-CoA hydrolase